MYYKVDTGPTSIVIIWGYLQYLCCCETLQIVRTSLPWSKLLSLQGSRRHGKPTYLQNAIHDVTLTLGSSSNRETDSAAIKTWHYRTNLWSITDQATGEGCRYCSANTNECSCYGNLGVWWEACQLATLVLPSSATAERVFSLTKNLFGEQQCHLLSDAIRLGLRLAYNSKQ